MATITQSQARVRQFGNAPFGNYSRIVFTLATNSVGAVVPSDVATGVASGDVIDLGELQKDMSLDDMLIRIGTGMSGSVTGSLGFKYSDGVDDAKVPQDAAYFGAGIALSSAALIRMTAAKKWIKLPKPARLILTTAGAANAKVSDIAIMIFGEMGSPS